MLNLMVRRRSILAILLVCSLSLVTIACGAASLLLLLGNIGTQLDKVITQMESSGVVPASVLTWATLVNSGIQAVSAAYQMGVTGLQLAGLILQDIANVPVPAGLIPPPYDTLIPLVIGAIGVLVAALPSAQHLPVGMKTADLNKPLSMSTKDRAAYTSFDTVCKTRGARLAALKLKAH